MTDQVQSLMQPTVLQLIYMPWIFDPFRFDKPAPWVVEPLQTTVTVSHSQHYAQEQCRCFEKLRKLPPLLNLLHLIVYPSVQFFHKTLYFVMDMDTDTDMCETDNIIEQVEVGWWEENLLWTMWIRTFTQYNPWILWDGNIWQYCPHAPSLPPYVRISFQVYVRVYKRGILCMHQWYPAIDTLPWLLDFSFHSWPPGNRPQNLDWNRTTIQDPFFMKCPNMVCLDKLQAARADYIWN